MSCAAWQCCFKSQLSSKVIPDLGKFMQDFARFFASDLNMFFIVFPCQEETFDFWCAQWSFNHVLPGTELFDFEPDWYRIVTERGLERRPWLFSAICGLKNGKTNSSTSLKTHADVQCMWMFIWRDSRLDAKPSGYSRLLQQYSAVAETKESHQSRNSLVQGFYCSSLPSKSPFSLPSAYD